MAPVKLPRYFGAAMIFEVPAIVASIMPVMARQPVVVQPRKIPLAAKVAVTAFLAVIVPVYLHTYGPTNFLWFCDAALMLTAAGTGRQIETFAVPLIDAFRPGLDHG